MLRRNKKFYAFSLFALVLKTLRKITDDKAERIVVLLFWPKQPWYSLFENLTICNQIRLCPTSDLFASFFSSPAISCLRCLRWCPRNFHSSIYRGISRESASVIINSITESTIKQYSKKYYTNGKSFVT